jgi:16S rRNA (guanine527-N7)-methyltransferase
MNPEQIAALLAERRGLQIEPQIATALSAYLELLLRWNARTNLTAVRDPESIVLRHFGESLMCARALPAGVKSLLDYGSGAGFPGAIFALARPEIAVTLGESQGKKAAFLAELVRTLNLSSKVHAGRVAALPPDLQFEAVTLRAVDHMEDACLEARGRVALGGWLVLMTTQTAMRAIAPSIPRMAWRVPVALSGTEQGVIAMGRALAE